MISPFIIGLNSIEITTEETEILQDLRPIGIILFKRNIENIDQTQKLIHDAKLAANNPNLMVLIDEEGGKVSRTNHLFNDDILAAGIIGKLFITDPNAAIELAETTTQQIIRRLKILDINVCCMPVCDLFFEDSDQIIGSRAYSSNPDIVIKLAKTCCNILAQNNIVPIIKHIPGHGRANCDSHLDLPVIKTEEHILAKTDFTVFTALKDMPMAMTAHIIYEAIDKRNPVTTSKKAINYIRNKIGFKNLLVSDDICMKALSGTVKEKIERTFMAGCDIVLHCNGDIKDLNQILEFKNKLQQ
jgi:beta-N-acetylhexosaminidase